MKKVICVIVGFLFISLVGCSKNEMIGEYEVAIVETTSNKEKSLITYYNDQLEIVGTKSLGYAELGSNFYRPEYYGDYVYLVPRGLQGRHDEKKVIGVDLKTGEEHDYQVNQNNILCTAVNSKYLFTGSNINAVSYLTRVAFSTGEETEIAFEHAYVSLIAANEQYVFVFSSSLDDAHMYAKIYIYDVENLELEHTIDISEYGIDQTKYYLDDQYLYFSNALDKNDQPNNMLGILDLNDFSLTKQLLDHDYPGDIQYLDENHLIIACTDAVQPTGTYVIVYQTDTKQQTSYDLNVPIMNIEVANDHLYVLGSDDTLHLYDVRHEMKPIKSVQHEITEGVYCSTLFVNTNQK